jgi:hypothetical protein
MVLMSQELLKKLVKELVLTQNLPHPLAMGLVKSIEDKVRDDEVLPNSR